MKKILLLALPLILLGFMLFYFAVYTGEPQNAQDLAIDSPEVLPGIVELGISVHPETVLQGDPAWVVVNGLATSTIESLTFNGRKLGIFDHEGKPSALIGIDLRMESGTYPLVLTLEDGRTVRKDLVIGERTIAKAPLGIPEDLGGNTPESERQLINTLVEEGRIISAVPTSNEKLWNGTFVYPVPEPIVITDTYGYSRLTGASTISHKGTDFRAPEGTPIYAMNSGLVRFSRELRNYGKTIIIDHGLGLHTIYMHLSEMEVRAGDTVRKGQQIGKSGQTGYTFGAHLHLTVRIGGISIDPEKFLNIFGSR